MSILRKRHFRSLANALALAAMLASANAAAVGVEPGKATPVQREQAQSRFVKGRELFTKAQYERALEEFAASHEIVASPNARLYSARCLRELGRLVAAYSEFGRTAIEARERSRDDARYVRTAESAEEERRAIAPKLGFLSVTITHATEGTLLRVGGEPIRRSGWSEPIPVAPGKSEVSLETPSRAPLNQSLELRPGETKSMSFDADAAPALPNDTAQAPVARPLAPVATEDPEKRRRTMRTASYIAGGIGALGFTMFFVFGALSNAKYSDLKTACNGGPCPLSRRDDIDAGKSDQTIANVGLVLGLVGAAGAATLFVLSAPKTQGVASTTIVVSPSGLGVRGAF